MCYSALIDKVIPEDIIINGFVNDHSLRKSFPASDRRRKKSTKERFEATFATIKSWMDQMRVASNDLIKHQIPLKKNPVNG